VFVKGWGGMGFHSPGPALTRGRWGYFSGKSRPAHSRCPPRTHSLDGVPFVTTHF